MEKPETSSPLDEFLNAKSMLTPGIAGATAMLITNALSSQFGLMPNYTGLVISFMFGLIVFKSKGKIKKWERGVFYCLNSLVIFSIAMGANQVGTDTSQRAEPLNEAVANSAEVASPSFFTNWIDGTVKLRNQVHASLHVLSDEQAKDVIHEFNQVAEAQGNATLPVNADAKEVIANFTNRTRVRSEFDPLILSYRQSQAPAMIGD